MYFRNRSSRTFQTPDGYRFGSGPTGKPCASTVAAAAVALAAAVRNERRSTLDGLCMRFIACDTPLLMIGNFLVEYSIKVGQIRKILNPKVAHYSISFGILQNG
jgi:hypothetical protein